MTSDILIHAVLPVWIVGFVVGGLAAYWFAMKYFVKDTTRNMRIMIVRSIWAGLLWPLTIAFAIVYGLVLFLKYTFMKLED